MNIVHGDGPVWVVTNGIFPSNCYLCGIGPGECFIVDPGLDAAPIEAALTELGVIPRAVLCTHGHFDHIGSAAHFQTRYGCPVHLHRNDLKTVRSSNFLLMAFKIPARITTPAVDEIDSEHLEIRVGGASVRFHPAPGHTPGSCLLQFRKVLFTGDTLYSRGVGLSNLPGEDSELLRQSILSMWNSFPDDTVVCPGHGEVSTFGAIKHNNSALLRFLRAEPSPTHQP